MYSTQDEMFSKEQRQQAFKTLIACSPEDAARKRAMLIYALDAPALALYFSGGAELNPLIAYVRGDMQKRKRLFQVVAERRKDDVFDPQRLKEVSSHVQHVKNYMTLRRHLERLAIRNENASRPEGDRLTSTGRVNFARTKWDEWRKGLEQREAAARKQRGLDKLPKDDRRQLVKAYWDDVEQKLEADYQKLQKRNL